MLDWAKKWMQKFLDVEPQHGMPTLNMHGKAVVQLQQEDGTVTRAVGPSNIYTVSGGGMTGTYAVIGPLRTPQKYYENN